MSTANHASTAPCADPTAVGPPTADPTRFAVRRRLAAVPALACLAAVTVLAGACGSSGPSSGSHAAGGSSSTTSSRTVAAAGAPMRVQFGTGSVGAADPTTTAPSEGGNPIPSGFAAGQDILITSSGFEPQTLEANVSAPVVWVNETTQPQRIIFDGFSVDSGTIPPGGSFTWSSTNAVAIGYHSASGKMGKLDMNPVQP